MIVSSTRPASHHRRRPAGRSAGQPGNRVFGRHRALPGYGDRLLAVSLDVSNLPRAATVAQAAAGRFGRIDILVNNAGRGRLGTVEEASPEEVEAVFQANFFGLLAVTRAVLPIMQAQKSGRILNTSSVGGFAQVPGWGIYGATNVADFA
jgi:NAD(P)-dependent dehydrogenase (short-subunit alcohol dehydrogenase family)